MSARQTVEAFHRLKAGRSPEMLPADRRTRKKSIPATAAWYVHPGDSPARRFYKVCAYRSAGTCSAHPPVSSRIADTFSTSFQRQSSLILVRCGQALPPFFHTPSPEIRNVGTRGSAGAEIFRICKLSVSRCQLVCYVTEIADMRYHHENNDKV